MQRVPVMASSGPVPGHMGHIAGYPHENGSIGPPCGVNSTYAAPMVKEGCGNGTTRIFSVNQGEMVLPVPHPVGVCARRHKRVTNAK